MSTINLLRDARVFFTTNVSTDTGIVSNGSAGVGNPAFSDSNTFEIQVLDGLSFSQSTGSDTVNINETGDTPVRGQRSYNTTIEAGDWSFSTYMRPSISGTTITAEEKYLWNAISAKDGLDGTSPGWADGTATPGTPPAITYAGAEVTFENSNQLQLQKFGLIIAMNGNTFVLDNCAVEGASIDFGIDQIATIAWTGKCTEIRQVAPITFGTLTGTTLPITGGLGTGDVKVKETDCSYLANKLSVVEVTFGTKTELQEGVPTQVPDVYTIPITGGNISIANNLTYLTPAVVGAVNKPITYFLGTRTFTGSLSAYLRYSSTESETGDLFDKIASAAETEDRPTGSIKVSLGGVGATRVEVYAPTAKLQVPNVTTDQVVGATFDFMPEGSAGIEDANELTVTYFHEYTAP